MLQTFVQPIGLTTAFMATCDSRYAGKDDLRAERAEAAHAVAIMMDGSCGEVLAYTALPKTHWPYRTRINECVAKGGHNFPQVAVLYADTNSTNATMNRK